ncbi:hypothetical protein CUM50_07900 [Enterococcus faecium]|nr:hypothetical protein [Enterococcus faecium]EGP5511256.1 hypothetical protein [Enterococcus faecium]PQC42952.1 hypothetical protein CUM95_01020 [Enterococcus faecium]PQD73305.1 hypothetical protein CUM50_07900 [Enterococcus faecium]
MPKYYYNNSVDDKHRHEVHTEHCQFLPNPFNRTLIGFEFSCAAAIQRAAREHPTMAFDGCYWCCRDCHKG